MPPTADPLVYAIATAELRLRAAAGADSRVIEARIVPFGVAVDTFEGREMFERGAFAGVDPTRVVLRADHEGPPRGAGLGDSIDEREDGAYMAFEAATTPGGDELLQLVRQGAYRNVSVGFEPIDSAIEDRDGERIVIRRRVMLREVSATWRPAYETAEILRTRKVGTMPPEVTPPPTETPAPPAAEPIAQAIAAFESRMVERMDAIEERSRALITLPPAPAPSLSRGPNAIHAGHWVSLALRHITGERVTELEMRALADVVTTDNLGVVPPNYRSEMLGFINRARPFMDSTREIPAGSSGMKLVFPRIVQRPIVGKQAAEKGELASRATIIDTVDADAETYGGAGDLSLQLLKRSSPEFLALWLELLAEAYAIETENAAVDALLAEAALVEGGELDPAAPAFGGAFENAAAVTQSPSIMPDRIWLSTAALSAFIDAKEPAGGGGRPLYPGLAEITGVAEGNNGGPMPIRLRPVWVPALDDELVDIIVGPSRGFAWAEDGTYTLQADVPAKAGRDVGLAGIVWFAPAYPAAFTTYTLPAPA